MSTPSPEKPVNGNLSQTVTQSHNGEAADALDEESLVRAYMDITGGTERQARGVFMFVLPEPRSETANSNN